MKTYPFTPSGVQDMQADLYALPDTQLELVAYHIQTDFSGWIQQTFDLDPGQQTFLINLSPFFITSSGFSTALAVRNRLAIRLVTPALKGMLTEKLIRKTNNLVDESDGDGGYEASGELEFEILYP